MHMEEDKAMLPTNDYVFQRIFGKVGNEEITKGLISAIIKREVKKVELDESPILEKDLRDDKVGVLDVKARLDDDQLCNIEMQLVQKTNIEKRIMFYWSKLYSGEIKEGDDYNELHKTIAILIADFELDNLKPIEKFHTKWEIREEEYSKIVLTEVLELHIIELPKLIEQLNKNHTSKKDKVVLWSLFITNPKELGEKIMSENEDIKKANEELEKISADKHEQYLAHLRQKHIMDTKAVEEYGYLKGKKEGREEGKAEGEAIGEARGEARGKKEMIKSMLKKGISIEVVADISKLSIEEIEKIIKES